MIDDAKHDKIAILQFVTTKIYARAFNSYARRQA